MEGIVAELVERVRLLEEWRERTESKLAKKKKNDLPDSGVSQIRKTFIEGYKQKFGHVYHWGVKENSLATGWIKSVPAERALWLVKWYLAWTDPWVTKQGHPFHLLVSQTVKLEAVLNRGGRYFKDVVDSNVSQRRIEDQLEVMNHVDRRAKENGSSKVGFDSKGIIQDESNKGVPSERGVTPPKRV